MTGLLDGKAVVITGSGRGLGRAYALHAAAHGAAVVVSDVVEGSADAVVSEIEAAGGRAVAHPADVTSWADAEALVERCVSEFGAIDGLVNNAGILTLARIDEHDEAQLRRIVEINLLGTAFCATHAARRMLAQGSGSIVNVTSGTQMGAPLMSAYSATKGGIASFTYSWAADLMGSGVRVNAISPMAFGAMNGASAEYAAKHGGTVAAPGSVPMAAPAGEMPAPETNAPVVTFLLSDAAADVHGQVVRVDGGRLSLVTHPATLAPTLLRDTWELEDVQAAFAQKLGALQLPVGRRTVELTVVDEPLVPFPG